MSIEPVIEVRDLWFRYADGTEALRGINFHLLPGETVALLGANGSGKTTFILHLNGLLQGKGSVTVCGIPVNAGTAQQVRRKIGLVFQDSESQLFMPTVLEDVAFGLMNLGISSAEALHRAAHALELAGIAEAANKAPYHLSAGEKRRASIAGILVMDPEILILDEPTTSLDPPGQRSLAELLAGLPQAKIIVTHDVEFARELADRAVFFHRGAISGEGSIDDLVIRFGWRALRLACLQCSMTRSARPACHGSRESSLRFSSFLFRIRPAPSAAWSGLPMNCLLA